MESWRRELYLAHHGIKGQKWGVRNGPPYPLGKSMRREMAKSAGPLDTRSGKAYNSKKRSRSGISKAVKVGAVAAVAALAVYGAYKVGVVDSLSDYGKSYARTAVHELGNKTIPNQAKTYIPNIPKTPVGTTVSGNYIPKKPPVTASARSEQPKRKPIIRDPRTGFKMIDETVEESLKNANPLRGSAEGGNNCTYSAIAGFLRTKGLDVTARGTPGAKMQNMAGVLEDCFKNVKVYEGRATTFAKSPEDAAAMLKKRFGDNASGAVGIDWRGGNGHTFNWSINNGVVQFLDFQQHNDDAAVRSYWDGMDPSGNLTFARLDLGNDGKPLVINLETIGKYVEGS